MIKEIRNVFKSKYFGDFAGSPVVKILWFHCMSMGSVPGLGTEILHAAHCGQKIWGGSKHFEGF